MDKKKILIEVIKLLEREYQTLWEAAVEAREAATNEESKAENKYDTRGLEASYLAGAQAKRTQEIKETLHLLGQLKLREFPGLTPISLSALVEVTDSEDDHRSFFLVPKQGGHTVTLNEPDLPSKIFTLSPESPWGQQLMGLKAGDFFEFKIRGELVEFEIVSVT